MPPALLPMPLAPTSHEPAPGSGQHPHVPGQLTLHHLLQDHMPFQHPHTPSTTALLACLLSQNQNDLMATPGSSPPASLSKSRCAQLVLSPPHRHYHSTQHHLLPQQGLKPSTPSLSSQPDLPHGSCPRHRQSPNNSAPPTDPTLAHLLLPLCQLHI